MGQYKKFLLSVFIFILIAYSGIAFFNYKIDSGGLFSTKSSIQQAIKEIINGNIVAGLGDEAFDDRQFQISLIKNINSPVDVIALGSSRTKELRSRYLEEGMHKFYNHAVNGASLEDYIAIIGAYKNFKGYLPKNIILGVDPWIFNKNNGRIRWKSIQNYSQLTSYIVPKKDNGLDIDNFTLKKYLELLNYAYTLANIRYTLHNLKKKEPYYIVNDIHVDDYLREPDASIQYPYETRFAKCDAIRLKAIQYTKGYVYGLENFTELGNRELFTKLIRYLQKNKVNVTLFLAPYHPFTYDTLIKNPNYQLKNVENYLINFAQTNQLTLIGSYNPYNVGAIQKDFFDGMHCHDYLIEEMFNPWNSKPQASPL